MIVGVYGLGYLIASVDPYRHWPIVLVGLLGKIFGPIGFLFSLGNGRWTPASSLLVITNDLIWWVPFAVIIYQAARYHSDPLSDPVRAVAQPTKSKGELLELSFERPLLMIFVRHFGCTFCREMLKKLATQKADLLAGGVQIVVVHMADRLQGEAFQQRYNLEEVIFVSDPGSVLYREFGLRRGSFMELFGLRAIVRALHSFAAGHEMGALAGDGFQMSGAFYLKKGQGVRCPRALVFWGRNRVLRTCRFRRGQLVSAAL
jgi:peroxiredoxin